MKKMVDGIEVDLTQEEIDEFNARQAAYTAAQTDYAKIAYKDVRKAKYDTQGCRFEDIVVALWEQVIENRPDSATAIQAIRTQIKTGAPKPI